MHDPIHDYLHVNNEVGEIVLSKFFRSFGLSLIGVFIPLFFLKEGLSLWTILIEYFAVYSLSLVMTNFLVTRHLLRRIGVKHTVILYLPFVIGQLVLLNIYEWFPVNPSLIAILAGMATSFYWLSMHTDFAMTAEDHDQGREAGLVFAAGKTAKAVGPFIGGLIIVSYGFPTLFLVAIGVILLSVIPLLRTPDTLKPREDDWRSFLNMKHFKYMSRFYVQGARGTIDKILWPMFIFLTLNNYVDVGLAGTLAITGAAAFSFVLGKKADNIGSTRLLTYTSVPLAVVYYLLPLARTEFSILILSVAVGFFTVGVQVPIYRSFLRHAGEHDAIGYTLSREMALHAGRITMLILTITMAGNFLTDPTSLTPVFHLAALAVLTLMLPGI